MKLFNETTLRKLEQLMLVANQVRVGVMKGDRRSRKRGSSVEFADYRNYVPGDDLRRLDWNVYARLERPFIKLLEEEEDLSVHLLLDSSASMDWPNEQGDERNKFRYGRLLAGALGQIGLGGGDLVQVTLLRSAGNLSWGPFRGRQNGARLFQFLESGSAQGITNLNLSLRYLLMRARRPGLLFLISDLLSPDGCQEGLNAALSRGYEVSLIHLLSPDEADPPLGGDVKLVDVETGDEVEITLDGGTIALYRRRRQEWQAEMAAFCRQRGIHYIPVVTSLPWEQLLLQTMRERGLVK